MSQVVVVSAVNPAEKQCKIYPPMHFYDPCY